MRAKLHNARLHCWQISLISFFGKPRKIWKKVLYMCNFPEKFILTGSTLKNIHFAPLETKMRTLYEDGWKLFLNRRTDYRFPHITARRKETQIAYMTDLSHYGILTLQGYLFCRAFIVHFYNLITISCSLSCSVSCSDKLDLKGHWWVDYLGTYT